MTREGIFVGLTPDQVRKLSYFASSIARESFEPEQVFSLMLEFAMEVSESDHGSINLVNKEGTGFRVAAIRGVPEGPIFGGAYPLEHGLSGIAFRTLRPIIVSDVLNDPDYIPLFAGVRSELAAPLMAGETPIGVINLESQDVDHFTLEHVQIVSLITSLLTLAFRSGVMNAESERAETAPTDESSQSKMSETVLVAMPFREPFNKYYHAILKPAVEDAGLSSIRSDELARPNDIMRDLWQIICKTKMVLAELTGTNPNVMYEVGLSHGIGKPVILIAQSIDDVPFDLRALRVVLYDTTDPDWAPRLRADTAKVILTVLKEGLSGPYPT